MSERQSPENDAPTIERDLCLNCQEPIETEGPNGWVHTGRVGPHDDGVPCELTFVAEPSGGLYGAPIPPEVTP